ncbi:AIPR family protein [Marivita sp. GX14005]|uniref:AIPR family protein n=1 Tax=Marivita sp. GX14005 TaxID=2942276 RepID=UPI002018CCF8|nr:AIPR family protein [Marivita sp. GX14005]MCL3881900.1 AIPR family protein [Marivita sp. GX14005]
MAIRPFRFEVAEARSFKHPHFPNIQKHIFLVPAARLPKEIPQKANLREATGMNRNVYKDVRESLRGNEALPGSFDLLNLGITIIGEDVKALDKRVFEVLIDDDYGIANGGHTANLIWECQDDDTIAEGQHVEVKIITGVEGPNEHTMRVDIARGQNTGIAVKPQSIFELDGAFQGIKDVVAPFEWSNDIAYKESDSSEIDVRELISALEIINVIDFPNRSGKHPIAAYEKWSTPLKKYGDDFKENRDEPGGRKYAKFEPLLPQVLELYDIIRRDFLRIYSKEVSNQAAKLKIVEDAPKKSGVFQFRFAGLEPHDRRLTKGAAYPILGSFRNYVRINPDSDQAEWVGGFDNVKVVWGEIGKDLVLETREAVKSIGNAPDVLGKNRNHWANLYRTVENHFLRSEIERLTAGGA